MPDLKHFDYRKSAREAGLSDDQLELIERMFRVDYPADDMLCELHVLRACKAVRDGLTTLDAVVREANGRLANAA